MNTKVFLSVTMIFFLVCVNSLNLRKSKRDYHKSCTNMRVEEFVFKATCKNDKGEPVEATLNLDHCFGNSNGKLVFKRNGNVSKKAKSCVIDETMRLSCVLPDNNNEDKVAKFDLRDNLSNKNGSIKCDKI